MPSSVIRAHRYDSDTKTLLIIFVSGRRYRYREVPPEAYEALRLSFSKGEHFNRHIKDRYAFVLEEEPSDRTSAATSERSLFS